MAYRICWAGWALIFYGKNSPICPWDGFWLAIPPMVYLFLKSLTNDQWRFSWRRDIWHFWAYGVYFIEHLIVGTIGLNDKNFVKWWGGLSFLDYFGFALNWGIEIYYFILSYRLYQEYRKWTFNEFSDPEQVSFKWFRNYLIVKFMVTIIAIVNSIYVQLSPENGSQFYALMWVGYLMDTILIYYLSISAYAQARVRAVRFNENDTKFVEIPLKMLEKPAYTEGGINEIKQENIKIKNPISEEDLNTWTNKVLTLFEKEQPYLNPELTLSDLADKLKTNTSILSQVINTGFNKNFNDFVNEYRVEDFKKKYNPLIFNILPYWLLLLSAVLIQKRLLIEP